MASWSEITIDAEVPIAARDHGGQGPALVLVHGAGLTVTSLEELAADLVADHRVISYDVRGHGLSGDGLFTFDTAVEDLRAVIEHFGLTEPTVVGHSLGGMIAALYGGRYDLRAAVNVDGHGLGVGIDPKDPEEAAFRQRMEDLRAKALTDQFDPVPAEAVDAQLAAFYSPEDLPAARARLARSLRDLGDGTFARRMGRDTVEQVMGAVNGADLFAAYRDCRCPLLIFNAVRRDQAAAERGGDPELAEIMARRREILGRSLDALAAEAPHVEITTVDATHNLIAEIPAEVSTAIREFLSRTSSPAPA